MKTPKSSGGDAWLARVALPAVLLFAASATALPPGDSLQMDDAACESIVRAPPLVGRSYVIVPPQHRARSFPVMDVRRLFDKNEADKTALVKQSLAEDNPIFCTLKTFGVLDRSGGAWKPADSLIARLTGRNKDDCRGAILIGYDNARDGGAFEVMKSCKGSSSDERFFWVRYADFERFCGCAVEIVGNRGADKSPVAGSVRLEESSGAVMRLRGQGRLQQMERAYKSGTQFRVLVSSNGPAYVYVLASDLSGDIHAVFPPDGSSAYLAYRENRVAIPDATSYLRLDERPGTDYFIALYSTRKLDVPQLIRQIRGASGDLTARLQAALAQDLVPEAAVQYTSSDEVALAATSADRPVVPVIVEIRHVP